MNHTEFNKLAKLHNLRGDTLEACRMVLLAWDSCYAAAKKLGIAESTVARALKRLQRPVCGECGKPKT